MVPKQTSLGEKSAEKVPTVTDWSNVKMPRSMKLKGNVSLREVIKVRARTEAVDPMNDPIETILKFLKIL